MKLSLPPTLTNHKITIFLIIGLVIILGLGFFGYQKLTATQRQQKPLEEVDLPFDPEGLYALLLPRRDGNALVLNIKRVASYEGISYELAYQSDGIDRGVQGTLNTDEKKNEYTQEILFGTCSKGDTFSTLHCVFDKNVENGTLTLKIKKGDKLYKMNTTWHLQKPDVALGVITSGDGHFNYKTTASRQELSLVGFSIVNDLSGVPKLPANKKVLGKVYGFNVPIAKTFPKGDVTIELIENPTADAKIYEYMEAQNDWKELNTKINGSKLSASAEVSGIFAVLVNSSNN